MSKKPGKIKKKSADYLKYTGLGFQMAAVFLVGILGGKKLDEYFNNETPFITILLISFLFIGFMYKLVKELK